MAISDDQVTQELYHLIATHPTLQPMRAIVRRLMAAGAMTSEDSDTFEHCMVEFLKSDAAWDGAMLGVGSAMAEALKPQVKPLPHPDPRVMSFEITAQPGTLPPAFDELARKQQG